MKVRSTPITPSQYIDKLNVFASNGQIGPGALDARAWPVEAHYFPPVGLEEALPVNDNIPVTGQSYQDTVYNQFIEVTNKWTADGTWFYYYELPANISQVVM